VSAPGWALVSTCPAPTWLRLTGAAEPTVLLPRPGRDCGALGGRKVRRRPWVAGHRSGVRYGRAWVSRRPRGPDGCGSGRVRVLADITARRPCIRPALSAADRTRPAGVRCYRKRSQAGVRCSGAANAARPATPIGPGGRELLPDVGHGRPLQRQGFLDSDGPVPQQSGGTGFALYRVRCLRQWVGAPPLLLGGGFVPFGELHEPVLYPQIGACCRAGCGRWGLSVRGETAGPRCPLQPRGGPPRSSWPTGSASARRRGRRRERTRHTAPAQDRAHSPAAR
jgi:hypothetical protein